MVCKYLIPYNAVFSLFIAYIAIIEAQNPEATVVPVTRVHISSLWQPSFDICRDPVHDGDHHGSNATNDFDSFNWTELRIKMAKFRDRLRSQDQAVRVYQKVSNMKHIFSILNSYGAKNCCLDNPVVYLNLTNRILPEIYYMVSGYITNWPRDSCTQRLTATVHGQLSCEEVRNVILLVYKYGMKQSRDIVHILRNVEN